MKRLTALLSALLLVSGLCSCGKADKSKDADSSANTSVSEKNVETETSEIETTTVSEDEESEASESDFIGKWELVKIIDNGEELTEEMTGGIPLYALCRFEMKDDFTAVTKSVFFYNGEIADESTEWEWEMGDDSKAYLHNEYTQFSDVQTYVTIEDGFLVLCEGEDTGNRAYLEKVDEFHSVEGLTVELPVEDEDEDFSTDEDLKAIAGKWECCDYEEDGVKVDFKESLGAEYSDMYRLHIKENGTGNFITMQGSDNETRTDLRIGSKSDGTFLIDENKGSEIYTVTLENDILTLTTETKMMKFKKVDEFTVTDWDKIFSEKGWG